MQFRDYATTEASALIEQLLEGPQKATHELEAFRQTLEDAGRRIEEVANRLRTTDREAGVAALVERLATAASAGGQALVQRAQAEAQVVLEQTRKEFEQRHAAIESKYGELESTYGVLESKYGELESKHAGLEARLSSEAREGKRLAAALQEARASVDSLRSDRQAALDREEAALEREKAATEREKAAAQREKAVRSELSAKDNVSANLDEAVEARERAVRTEMAAAVQELKSLVDEAQQELARVREELTVETADRARLEEQVAQARQQPAPAQSSEPLDRLLTVFHELATGDTIPDVLVHLARGLSADFRRIALFNVKGKRLEGVYQSGFDFASDISKLALPLTPDTLLTAAIESGDVESRDAGEDRPAAPAPFDSGNGCAIALPVIVGGQALAVVYADDGDHPASDAAALQDRVKIAEILQRHAAPRVAALAAEQKSIEELRSYARLLIDEVDNMYAADAAAGLKDDDLQARLRENVECARQIFGQRVASEGPASAGLLDQLIAETVEAKQNTPFGRDLSVASTRRAKRPAGRQRKSGTR
jgi:hypothetical protein